MSDRKDQFDSYQFELPDPLQDDAEFHVEEYELFVERIQNASLEQVERMMERALEHDPHGEAVEMLTQRLRVLRPAPVIDKDGKKGDC